MTLANKFQMTSEVIREIGMGYMLFEIGNKSIPYETVMKEGTLEPQEFQLIRKHLSTARKDLNDMKYYS